MIHCLFAYRHVCFVALTMFMTLIVVTSATARTIHVTPNGPMTIQQALDQAQPGDTVKLAPGVYYERIQFPRSGEYGRPITLEGEDGAIIDGRHETELHWEPAFDIAPGLYRAKVDWKPWFFTADGKTLTQLNYKRCRLGAKAGSWASLFKNGPEGRTLKGIEALAMTNDDEQYIYVRFADNRDPATMNWALGTKRPVVIMNNVDRVVIRNVEIRTGWMGVYISQSMGAVVEHCKIGPTRHGVWLGRDADRATVRFNDISAYPHAVTGPHPKGGTQRGRENWTNWLAVKRSGYWDSFGVRAIATAGGHQIHDNHIHNHWGGVEEWATATDQNHAMNVHHNLIVNISDDGLEPSGSQTDGQWHHNIVLGAACGFRIKHVNAGPLYAYHNIFFNCTEDFRIFNGSAPSTEVFVYHNTSNTRPAISSNAVKSQDKTAGYHFLNNLFNCQFWWQQARGSVEPNWMSNYNAIVRHGTNPNWETMQALAKKLGMEQQSKWVATGGPGFVDLPGYNVELRDDSPAIDAGANLAILLQRTLPGLTGNYFTGNAPDAGALQLGEAMPVVPRPRESIANLPAAGHWPGADAKRHIVIGNTKKPGSTYEPNLTGDAVQRWKTPPAKGPGKSARFDFDKLIPTGDFNAGAVEPAGENMLINGDFANVNESNQPRHWRVGNRKGTQHEVYVDKEKHPDDLEQSLRVNVMGTANGLGEVTQRVDVTPNKKYRLTGWINGSVGNVAMIQIKLRNQKELKRITGNWNKKGWTPVTIDFVAEGATKIDVVCRFKQNSHAQGQSVWFADLHLDKIDK